MKVYDITQYVTDIRWEGGNLVAEAQIDDSKFIEDIGGMSLSFSVDYIDWNLLRLVMGYPEPDFRKMHADYRRKTRRRNRRR